MVATPVADAWAQHMQRGQYEAAWVLSDAVLAARRGRTSWHRPRHEQFVWSGEPLHGRRVLVRCYHGLGDTIQFVRYAPMLRAIAREVTFWVQPALLELLATVDGIDHLLPLHDGDPAVAYDVDVEVMELAHVFRSTTETLPATVPYLHAPEIAPIVPDRFTIGVTWQAGGWDARRSMALEHLLPLLQLAGITVVSLQRGPARSEWRDAYGPDIGCDNVMHTASVMRSLDLVLTVDSMPAHLAGALGVPVWTMLPFEADWRWPATGDRTPWYPTMRLFRQQAAGDWRDVITGVAAALRDALAARPRGSAAMPVAAHAQPATPFREQSA